MFQFEHQTFNPSIHTLAGIMEMVKDTFLEAKVDTEGINAEVVSSSDLIIPDFNHQGSVSQNPIDAGTLTPLTPSADSSIIYPGIETVPYDPNVPVIPIIMNNDKDDDEDIRVSGFSSVYIPDTVNNLENLGPAAGLPGRALSGQSQIIDTTGENDARFVEAMPELKKMLKKLDLDISFLKSTIDEEDAKNKRKIYFFNVGNNPINYKIDDLNEEELIKYSLVIIYLMLKNFASLL